MDLSMIVFSSAHSEIVSGAKRNGRITIRDNLLNISGNAGYYHKSVMRLADHLDHFQVDDDKPVDLPGETPPFPAGKPGRDRREKGLRVRLDPVHPFHFNCFDL
jgi:hypothetical protein